MKLIGVAHQIPSDQGIRIKGYYYQKTKKESSLFFFSSFLFFFLIQTLFPEVGVDVTNWVDEMFPSSLPASNTLERQVNSYFAGPPIGKEEDPLRWWKLRQKEIPALSDLARVFLAVPATSTPAERAFSSGRRILPFDRSRRTSETLEALMCLKNWTRQLNKIKLSQKNCLE